MGKDLNKKELGRGIVQHRNGYYYGRFVNRYGKRISICNKDKKELVRQFYRLKYKDECRIDNNGLAGYTVAEWFDKCVNDVFDVRDTTLQNYKTQFKHISSHIGTIDIALVEPMHIIEIVNKMKQPYFDSKTNKEKRYSINTIRATKVLCHNLFQQAKILNYIRSNPTVDIRVKDYKDVICEDGKYEKIMKEKALTAEEQRLFLDAARSSYYYELYELLFNTGLRVSEALALRWKDIDLERKIVTVKRTFVEVKEKDKYICKIHPPKSQSSRRTISIDDNMVEILRRQKIKTSKIRRKSNGFGELIFITRNGNQISTKSVRNTMNAIVAKMNKNGVVIKHLSPHMCRHCMVCRYFENGVDIVTISRRLGHKKLSTTTDIYLHIFEEVEAKKLELVNKQDNGNEN